MSDAMQRYRRPSTWWSLRRRRRLLRSSQHALYKQSSELRRQMSMQREQQPSIDPFGVWWQVLDPELEPAPQTGSIRDVQVQVERQGRPVQSGTVFEGWPTVIAPRPTGGLFRQSSRSMRELDRLFEPLQSLPRGRCQADGELIPVVRPPILRRIAFLGLSHPDPLDVSLSLRGPRYPRRPAVGQPSASA